MMSDDKPELKRFYKTVSVALNQDNVYEVRLDGRPAKTPRRAALASPRSAVAELVAGEWAAAPEIIDPHAMRLTKTLSTAVDLGPGARAAWIGEILNYLSSDLLCYRADAPAALAERQEKVWSPYLVKFDARFGVALKVTTGIVAIDQPGAAMTAVGDWLAARDNEQLCCLNDLTALVGSAVLALALAAENASPESVFAAARLDETFQREQWGEDDEAMAREADLKAAFDATALFAGVVFNGAPEETSGGC
ncbi:MAG: ATP12 family protein [Pseudomonadota bacterium]